MIWRKVLISVFVSISLLLLTSISLFAEEREGIESKLSIDIGMEHMKYEEHEPDTDLDSSASVNNAVVGLEGLKRWDNVFIGTKAVIPAMNNSDEETWIRSGTTIQTNSLEYGWTRIDGYAGYSLMSWLNPYGGVRWSEGRQDRSAFIVLGSSVPGNSREIIKSWSILFGIRGEDKFASKWRWNYSFEYFLPIDVEVTNSSLQGFKATDNGGYTLALKGGVEYSFTETFSFGILLYGGRMHWDGSGWLPFSGGIAKWPQNDTDYIGGVLNFNWSIL